MSADHEGAVRLLLAGWSASPPPAERVAAYVLAVDDLPAEAVSGAVMRLVRTAGRYPPSPPELRRAALLADDPPDPGDGWAEVLAEIHRVGRYGTPELGPLTARAVAAVGGWLALCDSTLPAADRARFVDAFERLAEREDRERLLNPRLVALGRGVLRELDPAADDDPDDDAPRWN